MCIHYESPFSTFYHYIFYYLRQSRDYTTTSINDIELYFAIENYNQLYIPKDPLSKLNPLWDDPIRYHHHVGAYSSFNLKIKEETKATIRCILSDGDISGKTCIYSGNPAKYEVIFSKAY